MILVSFSKFNKQNLQQNLEYNNTATKPTTIAAIIPTTASNNYKQPTDNNKITIKYDIK